MTMSIFNKIVNQRGKQPYSNYSQEGIDHFANLQFLSNST